MHELTKNLQKLVWHISNLQIYAYCMSQSWKANMRNNLSHKVTTYGSWDDWKLSMLYLAVNKNLLCYITKIRIIMWPRTCRVFYSLTMLGRWVGGSVYYWCRQTETVAVCHTTRPHLQYPQQTPFCRAVWKQGTELYVISFQDHFKMAPIKIL